jgi:23S rRNA (cytosine1962-C5)-methyltransferase
MSEIIIKPGRERSILRHHPWIFSGSVIAINGSPKTGETVEVLSSIGKFLGRAAINHNSNILGRIWTWDINEPVDSILLEARVKQAIEMRRKLSGMLQSNAMRLVHGESDGLPGLILDQYNEVVVVQFLTAGVEFWRDSLIDIIQRNTNATLIYERSDVDVRLLEGLSSVAGRISGMIPENTIIITENGINFKVDITHGHKTGFYLDQRENRLLARKLAKDLRVLDCFAYTGGFATNALVGQAESVTLVDSSASVLNLARENILINDLNLDQVEIVEQDVFKYLRTLRDRGDTFDLIILDPPKFAPTVAQAERAARGYKDINLLAFKILKPGGYLMTFSCSGGVNEDLFQKIVAGAAIDAEVDAVIVERLHQAIDHPVALNFPEGAYLKGFLVQKRNKSLI